MIPTVNTSIILAFAFLSCYGCAKNGDDLMDPHPPNLPIENYPPEVTLTWVSSARPLRGSLHIARTTSNGKTSQITYLTDSPYNDYKPVISPDSTKIAFFRAYNEGENFFLWNSSICVMNIDGSDLRELTGHVFMNTEPYWTRDGTNCITWSRMIHSSEGTFGTYVYRTGQDASPGDEVQISATNWEWGNSSLRDGRMFVSRDGAHFLLNPDPDGNPRYEEISYPDSYHYLHKVTISNDETMIAYMKKVVPVGDDYLGSQIVYANLDASVPAITNEVVFVQRNENKFSWYVSISPDNKYLIYAEDGKIMIHDMETGTNSQFSTMNDVEYRYPTFDGSVK